MILVTKYQGMSRNVWFGATTVMRPEEIIQLDFIKEQTKRFRFHCFSLKVVNVENSVTRYFLVAKIRKGRRYYPVAELWSSNKNDLLNFFPITKQQMSHHENHSQNSLCQA
jgi:hypothetical protein